MKNKNFISIVLTLGISLFLFSCSRDSETAEEKQSGAGQALDHWAFIRSYPGYKIPAFKIAKAFEQAKKQAMHRNGGNQPTWEALGPKNIGGRTLCLAFHPTDPNIIFAGSASGGLWKSVTAGKGPNAWERIPTGYPVLGVAAIAIDPLDPDVIYLGTGEVYNYHHTGTGFADRTTRGTYGIGILKSTDGGQTWEKSLDWSMEDLRGVQDLLINPLNPNTLFAATTEGIYKTLNAGQDWEKVCPTRMAVDLDMHVADTSTIYATFGSYDPDYKHITGIYRSTDAGNSFVELSAGLPGHYSGKAMLAISPSSPEALYLSIAETFESIGLFKSTDYGDSWQMVNDENVAKWQGWYAHDVAVSPSNENKLMHVGIDVHKSVDGGQTLFQKSFWNKWYFGQTTVGGPEGPPDYVHADIHAVYYHPAQNGHVFLATDGGVFVSEDYGQTFEGRNGGYQTQQFYADFSNSPEDSAFAIGGMQDNATAIYTGEDAWTRVIGGDGMSTAFHPLNDSIIFASSQRLGLRRSENRGKNFKYIAPPNVGGDNRCFNSPYRLAPSRPNTIYAGTEYLYRSDSLGNEDTWFKTSASPVDGGNPILTIAVSPTDENFLYISTYPLEKKPPRVMCTYDGGQTWTEVAGLPDRVATDIVFDPENDQVAYVTFSGFNTFHLFKTSDAGLTWSICGTDLPDVPANSLAIDPEFPDHLYLGNDIGVFFSNNAGLNWDFFSAGLPDAVLAMDLSISPVNRKLRLATHGTGVWEADLEEGIMVSTQGSFEEADKIDLVIYPNPTSGLLTLSFTAPEKSEVNVKVFDIQGRLVRSVANSNRGTVGTVPGQWEWSLDLGDLPAGIYWVKIEFSKSDLNFAKLSKFSKI